MLRLFKRCWCVWVLMGSVASAPAFSLLGPFNEAYQIFALGYGIAGDIGAPKNLGEEYRWNLPIINYAFDQNFLDYFGSNGVVAVEQAIEILNNLANVSSYSSDLSEFPLESTRENYRAQALGLLDLKSSALELLVEQLGLAEPDRYTWTLRNRTLPPGAQCPNYIYTVIKRNFDPVTFEPSSYVNGTLFTYRIFEFCPALDQAIAIEILVDQSADAFSAVASRGAFFGEFYTGLTRDDVGGLRYLYRPNNFNVESAPPNTRVISGGITNTTMPLLLTNLNLATFASQALTNDAAQLLALYPNLLITGTTVFFTNVVETNIFFTFTNLPISPVGSPATLVTNIVRTTNVATYFRHNFANVITNLFFPNGLVTIRDTLVAPPPLSPVGTPPRTNVTVTTRSQNFVTGGFFIVPTNFCGIHVVSTQLVTIIQVTNSIAVATNAPTTTNVNNQSFTREIITYFTNFVLVVFPVECGTNGTGLRRGVNKITFVRHNFDSLLGQLFVPVTNRFQLTLVANNMPIVQTFERVITQPDLVFSAEDLAGGPAPFPIPNPSASRSINFNTTNVLNQLAGPGTIEPPTRMSFNKVGPRYFNSNPFFTDEVTAFLLFIWGSFDGTTNAPIVYPSGTSILNVEDQVLIDVTTGLLPNGRVGVAYSAQLTASGGRSPYSWSLHPDFPSLPPGLNLSSDGTISGTPTAAGTFKFVVRLTDADTRTVQRELSIAIIP